MSQDNWQIVASHLGILKAGGTVMFLDTTLPDALISHMLNDAQPVVTLTRGQGKIRDPADARCPDVAGGYPQENRRLGWTTPRSALRLSGTPFETALSMAGVTVLTAEQEIPIIDAAIWHCQ